MEAIVTTIPCTAELEESATLTVEAEAVEELVNVRAIGVETEPT
jgi:hypothetical protein